MKTSFQQMIRRVAAMILIAAGCSVCPATTVVFSNLVADNAGSSQRLTDSHGSPLAAGSWVHLGAFGNLSPSEITALAGQGKQALLAAFIPFGASSSLGTGTASVGGRVEFSGSVSLTEPLGGLHVIIFNGPSPQAANEVLVASLPGTAPPDDASGLDGYLAVHMQDATLLVGNSTANGLATSEISGSYEMWIAAQTISDATPDDLLPGADADRDGNSNLAEYAFGSDPGNPSSRAESQLLENGGVFKIRFLGRSDDPTLDIDVETSPDMTANSWLVSNSPVIEVTSPPHPAPPGLRWMEVEIPSSGERGFVRLRANLIP